GRVAERHVGERAREILASHRQTPPVAARQRDRLADRHLDTEIALRALELFGNGFARRPLAHGDGEALRAYVLLEGSIEGRDVHVAAVYQPCRSECRARRVPWAPRIPPAPGPPLLAQLLQALVGQLGLTRARVSRLQPHERGARARLVAQLLVGHAELVERGRHAVALGIAALHLQVGDLRAVVPGQRVERFAHAVERIVGQLVIGRRGQERTEAGER